MKITIILPLSTALDISRSVEMQNLLKQADSENKKIILGLDEENKAAILHVEGVHVYEEIPWELANATIVAQAERIAALDDDAPGEGHPIDLLFPIIFNEAMKDGLDKAIMLLLCSQCDMGAEEIAWLDIDEIRDGVLLRHGIAPRILDYDTWDMLQAYVNELRSVVGNGSPLFLGSHGGRITPEEVTAALAGYALKAGVVATVDDIRAYGRRERGSR